MLAGRNGSKINKRENMTVLPPNTIDTPITVGSKHRDYRRQLGNNIISGSVLVTPVSRPQDQLHQEEEEDAGGQDVEHPGVRQGGQEGDGAELPVVAEDGGTEQAERVEDPEVAVGQKPGQSKIYQSAVRC